MIKYNTIIICLFGILTAQKLPYGEPKYFEMNVNKELHQIIVTVPFRIPHNIIENIQPVQYQSRDLYFLKLHLEKTEPAHFKLINSHFTGDMTVFFIDLDTKGWVGPYSKETIQNTLPFISGRLNTQNILIEISVPAGNDITFPVQEIIGPERRPDNFNDVTIPTVKDKTSPNRKIIRPEKPDGFSSRGSPSQRDHLKNILLCGYWPPSNECIRPFSTNETLNPDGWIGDNWEERGYDVVSYFPTFSPPDCNGCGQGNGDLEVDYQDTSEDWWNIVDSINPVAIITFSRGNIDYSWELEWQYTNYVSWIEDFEEPLYPTPSPPDSIYPPNTPRYSSLPMDSIEAAISVAGLGLYPLIDYTYGAGNYLSEFLGYHGVWYKAQMDSLNNLNTVCYLAGHIHIGGLVDWDDAHEAVKVTLREVINVIDESEVIIGDINDDGLISILDLYFVVSFLMGEIEFDENELIIADVNFDLSVDIYDLLMISNILLDS